MYVCSHVRTYVCMYVRTYVCTYVDELGVIGIATEFLYNVAILFSCGTD